MQGLPRQSDRMQSKKRQNELNREWISLAPAWIREIREGDNCSREGLLDGPMLGACGNVKGLRILDCGCGEGRFCRMLVERGAAYVLGLDLCAPMILAAKELSSKKEEYQVADVQDLTFLSPGSFDLCVSYLNQCDLPDFTANNREVFRVLKPSGRFIVANLHPMRSAVGRWQEDADAKKLHVILDNYFDQTERHWKMLGVYFTNFHRTLSTYLEGFLSAGFIIEKVAEPTVSSEKLCNYPQLEDELRVPNFIIYILRKP